MNLAETRHMPITSKLYQNTTLLTSPGQRLPEDNTKDHRLTRRVHQNLKPQSDDGGPLLWRKTQLPVKPPPPRPPAQETGARWAMWVPAAWEAGGRPGRWRWLGAGRLGARTSGRRWAPRRPSPPTSIVSRAWLRSGPENKGGDQHVGQRTGPVPGGAGRRGRELPGPGLLRRRAVGGAGSPPRPPRGISMDSSPRPPAPRAGTGEARRGPGLAGVWDPASGNWKPTAILGGSLAARVKFFLALFLFLLPFSPRPHPFQREAYPAAGSVSFSAAWSREKKRAWEPVLSGRGAASSVGRRGEDGTLSFKASTSKIEDTDYVAVYLVRLHWTWLPLGQVPPSCDKLASLTLGATTANSAWPRVPALLLIPIIFRDCLRHVRKPDLILRRREHVLSRGGYWRGSRDPAGKRVKVRIQKFGVWNASVKNTLSNRWKRETKTSHPIKRPTLSGAWLAGTYSPLGT